MQKLLSFATDFYFASKNPLYPYLSNEFNQLQVLAYQNEQLSSVMKNLNIDESDQFLLYARKYNLIYELYQKLYHSYYRLLRFMAQ
jgi:hypothetical protein